MIQLENNDKLLAYIRRIYCYENNIFILNKRSTVISHFDHDGGFIKEVDRTGQGPGEYSMIWDMYVFNDHIYVLDGDIRKIFKYDFAGNCIKEISIEENLTNSLTEILVNSDNEIIITSRYNDDYYIHIFDQNGNKIKDFFQDKKSWLI